LPKNIKHGVCFKVSFRNDTQGRGALESALLNRFKRGLDREPQPFSPGRLPSAILLPPVEKAGMAS
jgi:hypothetical protein